MGDTIMATPRLTEREDQFMGSWRLYTPQGKPTMLAFEVIMLRSRGKAVKGRIPGWALVRRLSGETEAVAIPRLQDEIDSGFLRRD